MTQPITVYQKFTTLIPCFRNKESLCYCSVAHWCPTLCDPMGCSTPGFPVHHHLLELAQTHVHWVSDAIQPSHSLLSPSPSAFNLSSIRVERVAIPFSRGSSQPRDWTQVSCIAGGFFTIWVTRKDQRVNRYAVKLICLYVSIWLNITNTTTKKKKRKI